MRPHEKAFSGLTDRRTVRRRFLAALRRIYFFLGRPRIFFQLYLSLLGNARLVRYRFTPNGHRNPLYRSVAEHLSALRTSHREFARRVIKTFEILRDAAGLLASGPLETSIAVKQDLAPERDLLDYYRAVRVNAKLVEKVRCDIVNPVDLEKTREEAFLRGDRIPYLNTYQIDRVGLEDIRRMRNTDRPVIFLKWHHGAHQLVSCMLCKMFPDLKRFSARIVKIGTNFSEPLRYEPALGLAKMVRCLQNRVPVLNSIDGLQGENRVPCTILGLKVSVAEGLAYLVKEYRPLVIPVTAYFRGEKQVEMYFGKPLYEDIGPDCDRKEIMGRAVAYFNDDLRKNAEHVNLFYANLMMKHALRRH